PHRGLWSAPAMTALDSEGHNTDAGIRMAQPLLGDEVERLVVDVLRSGHLAQGPVVARFEELAGRMAGADHAVAMCNGTAALETALELVGRPGAEVITAALT